MAIDLDPVRPGSWSSVHENLVPAIMPRNHYDVVDAVALALADGSIRFRHQGLELMILNKDDQADVEAAWKIPETAEIFLVE